MSEEEKNNSEKEERKTFQSINCEYCNSSGKYENKECPNCRGRGVVFWFDKTLFYWGKKITTLSILENKLEKTARKIVNGTLFAFGIGGFLFFLYYIYSSSLQTFITVEFWLTQPWETLVFWFSLVTDMYLIYRLDKESSAKQKVKKREYNEAIGVFLMGDVWAEIAKLPRKSEVEISKSFSDNSLKATEEAWRLAGKFKHPEIRPVHIFASLLFFQKVDLIFARLGINIQDLAKKINRLLNKQEFHEFKQNDERVFSVKAKESLFSAYLEAYVAREAQVSVIDLLLAISKVDEDVQEVLFDLKVDLNKIKNVVSWIRVNELMLKSSRQYQKSALLKPGSGMDRAMTAVATPVLDHFSQDLTLLAKFGYLEPCVGREKEIKNIFRAMEASGQSVILSGQPGVGKTTIIGGIARLMVTEEVPEIIKDKRIISLSIARLVSGSSPAEAQGRLMDVITEIRRAGNIVLFIQDIQDMMGISSGGEESLDLAEVLVSEISQGAFLAFATTTSTDYTRYIEGSSLGDIMQKVNIEEPEIDETIQILEAKTARIEYKNQVYFSYNAIEQAVKLSKRYIHDRFLPEKAIKIIEQSAVYAHKNKGPKAIVTAEDVAKLISEKVNIPLTSVTEEEGEKLLKLEQKIHERIVGQDEAVNMVSSALRRARAELRDMNRPIANFLFLGPTGVGKTELAKTVAEVYFGSEENMTRLDMSEYQSQSSINRLIGSPPGSGGVGTGGYLTESVRKTPFTLLLLDELEKAHPDILNVFLQLMEDGRLTDGLGRTVDFTNVILIATSNSGTGFIQDKVREGWALEDIKNAIMEDEIKKSFRPEFVNRFDGVIVFKPLGLKEVLAIARLLLRKVAKQLKAKGINLQSTDEAIKELAELGFDPQYGARPLRRVIQEKVSDSLANFLLTGKIGRRDTVVLDRGGKLRVEKADKL